MSSSTKDIILAISPALFGVIGTVLGARAATSGATAERRAKEDNEARRRLAVITDALIAVERGFDGRRMDPAQMAVTLRQSASDSRAPLLTAGVSYRTAYAGLMVIDLLADVLAGSTAGLQALPPSEFLGAGNKVVFSLVELLDHGRRYRRSSRASRKLLSRIFFSSRALWERVQAGLPETEPRRWRPN